MSEGPPFKTWRCEILCAAEHLEKCDVLRKGATSFVGAILDNTEESMLLIRFRTLQFNFSYKESLW